jgi:hypothetical protein
MSCSGPRLGEPTGLRWPRPLASRGSCSCGWGPSPGTNPELNPRHRRGTAPLRRIAAQLSFIRKRRHPGRGYRLRLWANRQSRRCRPRPPRLRWKREPDLERRLWCNLRRDGLQCVVIAIDEFVAVGRQRPPEMEQQLRATVVEHADRSLVPSVTREDEGVTLRRLEGSSRVTLAVSARLERAREQLIRLEAAHDQVRLWNANGRANADLRRHRRATAGPSRRRRRAGCSARLDFVPRASFWHRGPTSNGV